MSKTKKIILFIISFSVCISLLTVSAFAQTYEFDREDILNEDTELHVTNGVNYSTHWKPSLVVNWEEGAMQDMEQYGKNYVVAQYDINYHPPTGGSNDKNTTCVYLRLRNLQNIQVKKGKRLRISFKIMYDGQIDFDALTTRCQPQGWYGDWADDGSLGGTQVTGESFRKNLGYVPPNSIGNYEVYWDNTYTDFKIDYLDICFLLYNNQSIDGKFVLWFFYDSLTVTVEDKPITNQDIIDNQDANTDKVIQSQKDQYEQEKQETENAGNDSVDSLLGAIPGDTDGLLNSFGNLINCMTTTEQKTKFSFGSLKTPSIMGIPSYTLVEDISLDLGRYEKENPTFKTILILVRALLTIALIIYCFKELYSTIQYVLTLRKGDST